MLCQLGCMVMHLGPPWPCNGRRLEKKVGGGEESGVSYIDFFPLMWFNKTILF